jgi:hypothetical protein
MRYTRSNRFYIVLLLILFSISAFEKVLTSSEGVTLVTNQQELNTTDRQFASVEASDNH